MSAIKAAAKHAIRAVDATLALITRPATESEKGRGEILIVGAPRSGSTLLYQALLASRRFAYMANAVSRFPRSAVSVTRLLGLAHKPAQIDYESTYGDTRHATGPSEAGEFWDLIFPWQDHHDVARDELERSRANILRSTIGGLSDYYEAPFLGKNLWNSLRILPIADSLPNCLFVVMHRDPFQIARSILQVFDSKFGKQPGWWGTRPRQLSHEGGDDRVREIALQITLTYQAIDTAREQLGDDRFFDLQYEEFCQNPSACLSGLDQFCSSRGVTYARIAKDPSPFEPSTRLELPRDSMNILQAEFAPDLAARIRGATPPL